MVRNYKHSVEYQLLRSGRHVEHLMKFSFQLFMTIQKLRIHRNRYCAVLNQRVLNIGKTSEDSSANDCCFFSNKIPYLCTSVLFFKCYFAL